MIISIMKLVICCNYRYAVISENLTLPSVGFREGARGAVAPPPHLASQVIQKDGCVVIKTQNTLILANSDVLYISMHNNLYLPKGCTHHTPGTTLVSSFSQNFKIYIKYSKSSLGGISVLHKTKYPIASGGLCPQTPCFRDPLL